MNALDFISVIDTVGYVLDLLTRHPSPQGEDYAV